METTYLEGWNKFEELYKPIHNPFREGQQFETYGDEYEYVLSQDPRHVWTWVSGDGADSLVNGVAWVNRFVYFITANPWDEDTNIEVLLSEEVECECYRDSDDGEYGDPSCQKCEGYGMITEYK